MVRDKINKILYFQHFKKETLYSTSKIYKAIKAPKYPNIQQKCLHFFITKLDLLYYFVHII